MTPANSSRLPPLLNTPTLLPAALVAALMLLLTAAGAGVFEALSLYSDKVSEGQAWRLLTANLVHFGWAHTLMNAAALLLCALTVNSDFSRTYFLTLLLFCSAAVGIGVFFLRPDYAPYAGLSGAIHGLLIAGFLLTRAYAPWLRALGAALVVGKLVQENLPGYEATDLQRLIPAAVAVESHVYGALAGALFAAAAYAVGALKRKY